MHRSAEEAPKKAIDAFMEIFVEVNAELCCCSTIICYRPALSLTASYGIYSALIFQGVFHLQEMQVLVLGYQCIVQKHKAGQAVI